MKLFPDIWDNYFTLDLKKTRFQTYFGVPIPPWKGEKLGSGHCTIRFVITGPIVSKKNNLSAHTFSKEAKQYIASKQVNGVVTAEMAIEAVRMVKAKIVGSKRYAAFLKEQRPKIEAQMAFWMERLGEKGLKFPLPAAAMNLRLYLKGRHVTDTVNKQQTIQDMLVHFGVIRNDDYASLNPIASAAECYSGRIVENIAFVSLSFRLNEKQGTGKMKEK